MHKFLLSVYVAAATISFSMMADPSLASDGLEGSMATSGISLLKLIGFMTLAGVAGGSVNYSLRPKEEGMGFDIWVKSVLAGTGASFLMPLFLNTICSTLVPNILDGKGKSGDVLVFVGFCLLGAISSRAFIQTLSDRVLREAQEAKRQAQEARDEVSEVEQTVATIVEPELEASAEVAGETAVQEELSEPDLDFLKAIDQSHFTLRSISGIAKQTGKSHAETAQLLEAMSTKAMVSSIEGKKGTKWILTTHGRQKITE